MRPEDVAQALALFDPVWDALMPREQANLLHELIERVGFDGRGHEVGLTFRATGITTLAQEARGLPERAA